MSNKDAPLEWIFAEEDEATREDLETEEQQVVIGNDDPTVRTLDGSRVSTTTSPAIRH